MAEKTPEWKLDCFGWLPLHKWIPEKLLGPEFGGEKYCKICDKWIITKRNKSHISWHAKEMKFVLARRHEEAMAAAAEARRIKAEERRIEREAMKLLGKGTK